MSKDLNALFKSKVLNDETKTVIREAFDGAVNAYRAEVEAEYAERLNEAVKELNADSVKMVEEAIAEELNSVAEELAEARSLEVEYANRLQEFKESYAEKTEELIKTLVSESVEEEMKELTEDIEFAKRHQFGVEVFEAFRGAYEKMNGSSDVDVHSQLEEAKKELNEYRRKDIINSLLESVQGEKRAVVETILEGVETDRLEAKFESLRPVIMKESKEEQDAPLNESDNGEEGKEGKVVMENGQEGEEAPVNESAVEDRIAERLARSLKWAARK